MVNNDAYLLKVFPQPPLTGFRKQGNLKNFLIDDCGTNQWIFYTSQYTLQLSENKVNSKNCCNSFLILIYKVFFYSNPTLEI